MKFLVSADGVYYKQNEAKKLESIGFIFVRGPWLSDEWEKQSGSKEVEIATLSDFVRFVKKFGRVEFDGTHITISRRMYDL